VSGEKHLLSLLRAAIDRYDMIPEPGRRIAVGVSGGKDSAALLVLLARLRRFYPRPFSLTAITLDPCFNGQPADYSAVEVLCEQLEVPYLLRRTDLWEIVFQKRRESNPCSLCARLRRGMLHRLAAEAGCDTVALGHHREDAAETFLMNLLSGGTLDCFKPVTVLDRRHIRLIRPLIFMPEAEIAAYVRKSGLPVVKSRCPVDGCTNRKRTRELLDELSRQYGCMEDKILSAMQKAGLSGWQ